MNAVTAHAGFGGFDCLSTRSFAVIQIYYNFAVVAADFERVKLYFNYSLRSRAGNDYELNIYQLLNLESGHIEKRRCRDADDQLTQTNNLRCGSAPFEFVLRSVPGVFFVALNRSTRDCVLYRTQFINSWRPTSSITSILMSCATKKETNRRAQQVRVYIRPQRYARRRRESCAVDRHAGCDIAIYL